MSVKTNNGPDYLGYKDFLVGGEYKQVDVQISAFHEANTQTSADGKVIDKPVIAFKGKPKKLILNSTNTDLIHFITGNPASEKWIGSQITLGVQIVPSFGSTEPAIRVIPHDGCIISRKAKKHLGKKAIWAPAPTPQPKGE